MSDPKYASYYTEDIAPLPFCPGCGHTKLVKALDKALVQLQLDPAKVVIVTDIGCIGLGIPLGSRRFGLHTVYHSGWFGRGDLQLFCGYG